MKTYKGFTLIELMVVVVILAILAAIAIPSYQAYIQRNVLAQAQNEVLKLAEQLERHKARNFSYRGFNADYLYTGSTSFTSNTQVITLPLQAVGSAIKYTLYIKDAATGNPLLTSTSASGQSWAIKAVSSDAANYTLLLTSTGVRCKNTTQANVTFSECGSPSDTGVKGW